MLAMDKFNRAWKLVNFKNGLECHEISNEKLRNYLYSYGGINLCWRNAIIQMLMNSTMFARMFAYVIEHHPDNITDTGICLRSLYGTKVYENVSTDLYINTDEYCSRLINNPDKRYEVTDSVCEHIEPFIKSLTTDGELYEDTKIRVITHHAPEVPININSAFDIPEEGYKVPIPNLLIVTTSIHYDESFDLIFPFKTIIKDYTFIMKSIIINVSNIHFYTILIDNDSKLFVVDSMENGRIEQIESLENELMNDKSKIISIVAYDRVE